MCGGSSIPEPQSPFQPSTTGALGGPRSEGRAGVPCQSGCHPPVGLLLMMTGVAPTPGLSLPGEAL